MLEVEAVLRSWGRSVGAVIPKELVNKNKLKSGDKIKLIIMKKTNPLKETFGKFKLARSSEDILKEIDEEGWDE